MGLKNSNTKWVLFLSCSENNPEERHIQDLAFGLLCLESAGINSNNIFIYIDGQNRNIIQQHISMGSAHQYQILPTSEFFNLKSQNTHENMMLFISGHGDLNGIDSTPPITPHRLLSEIKSTPNLNKAIIYLGQCYAGIFNYIGAGRGQTRDSNTDVIIIGATNLNESISSYTTENFLNNPKPWAANLFLLNIFKWIATPIDVDGDGEITIMDSYKYAGVQSNVMNRRVKIQSFVSSVNLHTEWTSAKQNHDNLNTVQSQLDLQSVTERYFDVLNINYVHQECWILNAIPAQKLKL
jgi:hypothetical protein